MELLVLAFLLIILFGFAGFFRAGSAHKRVDQLKAELDDLRSRLAYMELRLPQEERSYGEAPSKPTAPGLGQHRREPARTPSYPPEEKPAAKVDPPVPEVIPAPVKEAAETAPEVAPAPAPHGPVSAPGPVPAEAPTLTLFGETRRSNVVDFLFRNIVGIIGALSALIGLVYLGYLGVFNLDPAGRSGVLAMVSLGAIGAALILGRLLPANPLHMWLQGIGGAVLLVTAVGAAGIPGLQFIPTDSPLGMGLVLGALVANTALAFRTRRPFLALFHNLFCFVALATGPASILSAVVAGGTSVAFGLYCIRGKSAWQLAGNAALTLAYFIFWQARQDAGSVPPLALYLLFALFFEFWILYGRPGIRKAMEGSSVPFAGVVLGVMLLAGPWLLGQSGWHMAALYGCATLVLALTWIDEVRHQRKDTRVLTVVLTALSGLEALASLLFTPTDPVLACLLIAVWTSVFRILAARRIAPEALGAPASAVEAVAWVAFSLVLAFKLETMPGGALPHPLQLLYLLPFASALLSGPRHAATSWGGWVSGIVAWAGLCLGLVQASLSGRGSHWSLVAAGLVLALGLLYADRRSWLKGGNAGMGMILFLLFLVAQDQGRLWGMDAGTMLALCLVLWGCLGLVPNGGKKPAMVPGALVLMTAGGIAVPFFLFSTSLPYLVGPLWLGVAAFLAFVPPWPGQERTTRILGLSALGLFWGHHFLVVLQSAQVLGLGPLSLTHTGLSAGTGIAAMVLMARKEPWKTRNLLVVPVLVLVGITLLVEFRSDALAPAFAVTALALRGLARRSGPRWHGLDKGSIWFHGASMLLLATISSALRLDAASWPAPSWWQALAAIACQLAYVGLQLRGPAFLPWPWETTGASPDKNPGDMKPSLLVMPSALTIALFLYWASDGLMLDLFWLLESFCLFGLGLALRQRILHAASLIGVTATMVHMVFWGLTSIDDMGKVIFLILTGIGLMAMALLYRRFAATPAAGRKA